MKAMTIGKLAKATGTALKPYAIMNAAVFCLRQTGCPPGIVSMDRKV